MSWREGRLGHGARRGPLETLSVEDCPIELLALAGDKTEDTRDHLAEHESLHRRVARADTVVQDYEVNGFPTHVVIDREGRITATLVSETAEGRSAPAIGGGGEAPGTAGAELGGDDRDPRHIDALAVRPGKAGMFRGSQSPEGKSQKPSSLDRIGEGNEADEVD